VDYLRQEADASDYLVIAQQLMRRRSSAIQYLVAELDTIMFSGALELLPDVPDAEPWARDQSAERMLQSLVDEFEHIVSELSPRWLPVAGNDPDAARFLDSLQHATDRLVTELRRTSSTNSEMSSPPAEAPTDSAVTTPRPHEIQGK
jgi:hypothetical protein